MAVLNERGIVTDNIPTLLIKLKQNLETNLLPTIPVGETIDLDDSSVLLRLLAPLIELIYLQEEAVQGVYSNLSIDTASAEKLDDLCALGGVYRLGASAANVLLMLYGELGTTIPIDSNVSSSITSDVFSTLEEVVLDTNNINGADFSFDAIGTNHDVLVTWSVDGSLNTNVPIIVAILSTDTAPQAALKVANAIAATTDNLTATVSGDNVRIILTNQNSTGIFTVTNLAQVNVFKPVDANCLTLGERPQNRLTINTIQSPVLGWLGVTNPFDANEGTFAENDEQLRRRYILAKISNGVSTYDKMLGALRNVSGVRFADMFNNRLGTTVNGVPSHSFAPIVLGGSEADIAQAIVTNHPMGVNSFGDTTEIGFDINQNPVSVQFSRPDLVPIKINLVLSIEQTFADNGAALIRQAIVDYFNTLTVGDDILYSRLFTPINSIDGFSVVNMQIGRVGGSFGTSNITIQYNELPTISFDDITFGGV